MNLGETGIGKERTFFVGAIRGCDVAAAGVSRKIEDVAIAASREHNGVAGVLVDLTGAQVACDDSFGVAIDNDNVEHLTLREHLDVACGDLPAKRLITTEKKLLPSLAPRVKRSRDLGAAEGAVGEQAAVLA